MKRFLLVLVLLLVLGYGLVQVARDKIGRDLRQPIQETKLSPTPTIAINPNQRTSTSIYVPYWTLDEGSTDQEYDNYIYFGIIPDTRGNISDEGASTVEKFQELIPSGKKSFVALRMVNSETNASILKDPSVQKKIISQTVSYAKKQGFDGVVLDLEMSALPFDSLIAQINSFTKDLATATKSNNLSFTMTLYGDTFYRVRPFDVKTLAQTTPSFMLMAYDFHKSRSNPGPNFPLRGSKKYGYDMTKLVDDISAHTDPKNVTIIFGMFGYDWQVDEDNKAVSQGKPLTFQQIQEKFLMECKFSECKITRDALSAETSVSYKDDSGQKHIVWFEDPKSVKEKQQFLRSRGITNFSFWAYSYF